MHFIPKLVAALTLSVLPCLSNPLSVRQDDGFINVCDEEPQCTIQCIAPTNAGPVFNDCHVIADTLRYISLASSKTNIVGTGTNNTIVMTYQTCKSFFWNSGTVPIHYCRPTWAEKLDEMAALCHHEGNRLGGKCVSPRNEWFIQFEHS